MKKKRFFSTQKNLLFGHQRVKIYERSAAMKPADSLDGIDFGCWFENDETLDDAKPYKDATSRQVQTFLQQTKAMHPNHWGKLIDFPVALPRSVGRIVYEYFIEVSPAQTQSILGDLCEDAPIRSLFPFRPKPGRAKHNQSNFCNIPPFGSFFFTGADAPPKKNQKKF